MKKLYRESKSDGFGKLVIAGVIMTAIQTLSVVAIVVLLLLWVLTQNTTFGWALLWPIGAIIVNILASLAVAGTASYKMSKEF